MPPKTSFFRRISNLSPKLSPVDNLAERKLKDKRAVIASFGFVRTFPTVYHNYRVFNQRASRASSLVQFTMDLVSGEGEEPTNDKSYQYLTTDDVLKMGDDTQMDVTAEEGRKTNSMSRSHHERGKALFTHLVFWLTLNLTMHHSGPVIDPAADSIEQKILQMEKSRDKPDFGHGYVEDKFAQSDNVNLSGPPIAAG